MSQQHLDDPDIDALLEQMSGKRVAQCMRAYPLMDLGALGRLLHDAVQLASRDRIRAAAAGEQPAMG